MQLWTRVPPACDSTVKDKKDRQGYLSEQICYFGHLPFSPTATSIQRFKAPSPARQMAKRQQYLNGLITTAAAIELPKYYSSSN